MVEARKVLSNVSILQVTTSLGRCYPNIASNAYLANSDDYILKPVRSHVGASTSLYDDDAENARLMALDFGRRIDRARENVRIEQGLEPGDEAVGRLREWLQRAALVALARRDFVAVIEIDHDGAVGFSLRDVQRQRSIWLEVSQDGSELRLWRSSSVVADEKIEPTEREWEACIAWLVDNAAAA